MYRAAELSDKPHIRRCYLARRRALSPREVAAHSQAASERLCAMPQYAEARCIHLYVAGKDNELDTQPLIARALRAGKEVAVPVIGHRSAISPPRVDVGSNAMGVAMIDDPNQLDAVHWGIPQPDPRTARWLDDWQRIDLAIIPGIAFDRRGRRIGYGAGHYDRFLPHLRAVRIGLCFETQLCPNVPTALHDIDMEWVATEQSIYQGGIP